MAIQKLVDVPDSPEELTDRVRCAGDALQGVRALLDEAGQAQKIPRPRVALDIDRILRTARLKRGKKNRQIWHSGTDIYKQLDEMSKVDPAETRRLIYALIDGIGQARLKGLDVEPYAFSAPPPKV
jgi:hypothetical protein